MEYFQECVSPSSSLSLSSTSSSSPLPHPSSPSSSLSFSSSSFSSSNPHPLSIDTELWLLSEQRTQEILCIIQPSLVSEQNRQNIIAYFQRLIKGYYGIEVFPFGSVPLKTFLPDGDIDLTALSHQNMEENLARYICGILQHNQQNSEVLVQDVQYIRAQVKIVKCTVNDIPVDISFNQTAGLSALCFLEKVDQLIGKDHLFKRSIILIKAWCYYESRILGAHHGLISTYALETMILYIINVFHSSLFGPLAVLYKFLDYYSTFDWANYCISLSGPVLVSSLPAVVAESPENDGDELLLSRDFLNHCRVAYSGSMQPLEIAPNVFPVKYLNIIDPLKESNNLGRSVSKGNFHRIRCALSFGAQRLSEILMLPGENMGMALEKFFVNTLDRNGRGQRPDVQIPVHAFGTGKSEVCDLSGDYNGYYNGLLYSQWYHNYALNLPYHPTALSSSSSSQTHRYSAWDALRRLVRCKRNSYYRKGTNVFIPRPPYSHPSALQLPAATYGATKSRGTGTFFPDMNHPSYRKMQASISTRNYVSSNPGLVLNPPKETDPIGDNGGNGDSHDLDLSTEQFPHLPTTERTMITHQSILPAPKNPQAENPSQFLPVLQFGNIYESSSPMDTYSPLCVPSIEKHKDLSEFDRTITEPFQLRDNNDFPPLVSM
ncbi:hypothetical protein ERO13_A06G179700v2 [Gossypium hirsutum]|uniref:Uncharacterized protein LOC107937698 isoform X1 n=2 Tax=Gossypium hirsutum TaxID=3635 RepID=A0A1U8MH46_GOSHI|nr:uncharacterized protein LOC107937698 isoform X1 [Gossypium hirsutum]XP_040972138.1 uncharacterized protein LOC107937698 isoform X1 [Gossypium hirsutum]KAG4196570.1 hypothetical protein ERO13_A06G179700v2 [Gossypium hirsutum]